MRGCSRWQEEGEGLSHGGDGCPGDGSHAAFHPLERLQGPEPAPACACMSRLGWPRVAPGRRRAGGQPGSVRREGASAPVLGLLGVPARSPPRRRAERARPEPGSHPQDAGSAPVGACGARSLGLATAVCGTGKVLGSLNARAVLTPDPPKSPLPLPSLEHTQVSSPA